MSAEKRLVDLGLTLPAAPTPLGAYVETVRSSNLLFVSGTLSVAGPERVIGRVGESLCVEDGRRAARMAALNALAIARDNLGSLDRISRVVRLSVSIVTTPDFTEHAIVGDGASELLVSIFGHSKVSTRLVAGVTSLPLGAAVLTEITFEVKES